MTPPSHRPAFLWPLLFCIPLWAAAAPPDAVPHDDNPPWPQPPQPIRSADTAAPKAPQTEAPPSKHLTEADLRANPDLTEQLINQAILHRQWDLLADLLAVYQTMPNHDGVLYDYGSGALLRGQGRLEQAVARYAAILRQRPELSYVRFDYMAMLFENHQYRQAEHQAAQLEQSNLLPEAKQLVAQYRQSMRQRQAWQADASLQYEQNDNVNNASSARELRLGSRVWLRDEASLPQKATGLRYNVTFDRAVNIGGNHFFTAGAGFDGVFYWDRREYNEETLRWQPGYRFRNIRSSWQLQPYVEYGWFSGSPYSRQYGIQGQYSRQLGSRWQLNLSAAHSRRHYRDPQIAQRYDGPQTQLAATAAWMPAANSLFYGGLDWWQQQTQDESEASIRRGIRFGLVKEWPKLGLRADLRLGRRQFRQTHFFFPVVRADRETQFNLSLWHPKLQWHGLMPRLSYRYLNINSNIPELYQRRSRQWFVEVERRF
ncbi:DUF560 domain-containing protein [Eikenella sp. S3360]|uniref:DUF560 domain-containing protein n=1 Tax=Eikenella glucosivorans TaxID=2766967 RepID=A0ABS0N6W9_9NEIS|nr:surface lipoprotein assembly modifier [Eikenella glucosivorans]MBH5328072.1 DUF560 domain-containing protein [Eikenella glucosivorans]